ncbi:MAG: hypothetical protein ABR543_15650 [Gemmatimonadaceae bacterium]
MRSVLCAAGRMVVVCFILLFPVASQANAQDWLPKNKVQPRLFGRYPAARSVGQVERSNFKPLSAAAESEPNNAPASANPANLGDIITGALDPANDIDWFAIDFTAGTIIELDVDAQSQGSPLDPVIGLFAPDSVTLISISDDFDQLDSRIRFLIPTTGRYFVAIIDFDGEGGAAYTYAINVGTLPPGPGDPVTIFASGLGGPWGIAAGAGEFFVVDRDTSRILRVGPQGSVSTLAGASVIGRPVDIAIDAFGNLLVAGRDLNGSGVITRLTLTGQASTFAAGLNGPTAITVGPDGDVWVADLTEILRFDLTGSPKGLVARASETIFDLAFSPAGELHFTTNSNGVYKLVNNNIQQVISAPPFLEGLAFDAAGNLYVANGFEGTISLYSPTYTLLGSNPFARSNLAGPINLAFGLDANGATTPRLFATNYGLTTVPPVASSMVEVKTSGVRGPGFKTGISLPTATAAANHLLGGTALTSQQAQLFDAIGNKNGRFDVGDFRAYLKALGQISAAQSISAKNDRGGKHP